MLGLGSCSHSAKWAWVGPQSATIGWKRKEEDDPMNILLICPGIGWKRKEEDHPMTILLSANRNTHQAFQFQECLVWDHRDIPRSLVRGWKRSKQRKKREFFWYPTQKKLFQTPRVDTGDSVVWFRCYYCSTLINHDRNLSSCGTFLSRLLPPPDIRVFLPTQKETYILFWLKLLRAFGHFVSQQRFLVPRIGTILVRFDHLSPVRDSKRVHPKQYR